MLEVEDEPDGESHSRCLLFMLLDNVNKEARNPSK